MKITIEIEDSKDYEQILKQLNHVCNVWCKGTKEEVMKKSYNPCEPYENLCDDPDYRGATCNELINNTMNFYCNGKKYTIKG